MKKNVKKLLALLLAAIMLLSLAACDKDETADVTGKYNCIAIAEDGVNFTAPENNDQYVELKKGGKGEIYTDLAFELTWKLDGENFSGSYQIFGEGLEPQEPQNEDVSGSEAGVSTAGYGKSNAAATGEVSLDTLKNGWETIRGDENKYDLHYEDVRDLMGCDGEAYKIDGAKNSYCWQAGNAILTVTFKVLDDGNEELNAFSVTGLD